MVYIIFLQNNNFVLYVGSDVDPPRSTLCYIYGYRQPRNEIPLNTLMAIVPLNPQGLIAPINLLYLSVHKRQLFFSVHHTSYHCTSPTTGGNCTTQSNVPHNPQVVIVKIRNTAKRQVIQNTKCFMTCSPVASHSSPTLLIIKGHCRQSFKQMFKIFYRSMSRKWCSMDNELFCVRLQKNCNVLMVTKDFDGKI